MSCRSAMTTRAPSATNSRTVASPMPLAPPVIMATLPSSCPMRSLLRFRWPHCDRSPPFAATIDPGAPTAAASAGANEFAALRTESARLGHALDHRPWLGFRLAILVEGVALLHVLHPRH